jgi:O-antigen ligase/tetratricopeptide (TPR) repeat protein
VVAAIGIVEALYGIYQVVARHPQIFWLRKTVYVDSATGTFVNRGHLAGYFELAIPITIALALSFIPARRRRRRSAQSRREAAPPRSGQGSASAIGLLLLGATATMLMAMGMTQSRGGVLSSLGGLAVGALALGAWRRQLTLRRVAIGAVALAALALLWLQSPQMMARFGGEMQLTPYSRPSLWRETLVMARDFPLFGVGLGNFEWLFPRYQPEGTRTYFDRAHNDYFQLLVESGVLGTVCFAWLFARFVGLLRRRVRDAQDVQVLIALGLITAMTALLFHSFTDFNLHIPSNGLLFTVAFGITVRLLDRGSELGLQGVVPLRRRAVAIAAIVAAGVAMVIVVRNYWVESLVRSIFPNTTLVNPLAGPPDSRPVQVHKVGTALRVASGQVELVEAAATFALQIGQDAMKRDRAYLASEARRQQTANAWAAAVQGFTHMVELRPSNAAAHLHLGEALSGLAEVRYGFYLPVDVVHAVVDIFDRAVWLQPRDRGWTRVAAEWALTHWGLLSADDQARAAKWTQQALTLDPERGRELLRTAIIWDPKLPEQLLPPDPEVRLYLALAYKDAGRLDDSARVAQALDDELGRALKSNDARLGDARLLGRVREFRGDPRGAAEAYGRAGMLAEDDLVRTEMLKHAGYNWLGANEPEKAQQALSAARRYGGRDPDVLTGLSAIYERRGDYAAAARLVRDAVAVAPPGASEYRYRLARLYEGGREYGKANEQYRRLLADPPTPFVHDHRSEILLALARNYRQLELGSEARQFYDLVLQADPENSEAKEFLAYFGS